MKATREQHYANRRARAIASEEARFWSKVDKADVDGCWEWTAGLGSGGYGQFGIIGDAPSGRRRTVRAHRYAYEKVVGPIPDGRLLMHSCDNPPCVNPDHLAPGTDKDNLRDASMKGRLPNSRTTHCPKGHPYDESNTRVRPNGWRACRECYRESSRERREQRECPHCGVMRDYSNMSRHIKTTHKDVA